MIGSGQKLLTAAAGAAGGGNLFDATTYSINSTQPIYGILNGISSYSKFSGWGGAYDYIVDGQGTVWEGGYGSFSNSQSITFTTITSAALVFQIPFTGNYVWVLGDSNGSLWVQNTGADGFSAGLSTLSNNSFDYTEYSTVFGPITYISDAQFIDSDEVYGFFNGSTGNAYYSLNYQNTEYVPIITYPSIIGVSNGAWFLGPDPDNSYIWNLNVWSNNTQVEIIADTLAVPQSFNGGNSAIVGSTSHIIDLSAYTDGFSPIVVYTLGNQSFWAICSDYGNYTEVEIRTSLL
jgi:hypothetical protein